MSVYDPATFWDRLIASNFDLRATGHASFGLGYNRMLYRAKVRCVQKLWSRHGISPGAGHSILELAPGVGFFTRMFDQAGAQVVGVDISPTSIARLRDELPGVELINADIGQTVPDLDGRTFDQVYALDVLYHIVDDDRFADALANIARWTRPGGYFLFSEALNKETMFPRANVAHVTLRSRDDYRRRLESHGFELVAIRPMYHALNRPLVGDYWPWTNRRLARIIRRRVCENVVVRNGLYWFDVLALPFCRWTANLKAALWRKREA